MMPTWYSISKIIFMATPTDFHALVMLIEYSSRLFREVAFNWVSPDTVLSVPGLQQSGTNSQNWCTTHSVYKKKCIDFIDFFFSFCIWPHLTVLAEEVQRLQKGGAWGQSTRQLYLRNMAPWQRVWAPPGDRRQRKNELLSWRKAICEWEIVKTSCLALTLHSNNIDQFQTRIGGSSVLPTSTWWHFFSPLYSRFSKLVLIPWQKHLLG